MNDLILSMARKSNVSRRMVEATISRSLTDEEYAAFLRARGEAEAARAAKKARGPMSVAERVAKHVAASNEIDEIPRVRHPRLKAACKYDLELFGWTYCRAALKHRASEDVKNGIIIPVQNAILSGGKIGVMCARGVGKTTWVQVIASIWAILYGHCRYPVLISASGKSAKKNLKNIKRMLSSSREILDDFPAVAIPIRRLGGISQRGASQTYHGEATEIEWGSEQIKLPTMHDELGELLDAGCGATMAAVGIGGSVRGANEGGQRPDYIILDDPQTKKDAQSPALVRKIIEYIESDALMLAGHDRMMSAFITITPQRYGDVAYELSSDRHPEWEFRVQPFIKKFPAAWNNLVIEFCDAYYRDLQRRDQRLTESKDWYIAHRDDFAEAEVVDELQYDHEREIDAVHHMLNMRASIGERAFNAELMMQVADMASQLELSTDQVCNAVNGFKRLILPPGIKECVAFSDVNIQAGKGMSWVVVGFGTKHVASVIAYGRYPESGPLVQPNSSADQRARQIAKGIKAVVTTVKNLEIRTHLGKRVYPLAMGFDRGFEAETIIRTIDVLSHTRVVPFNLVALRGVGDNFKGKVLRKGDHVYATESSLGKYLAVVSAYWREKMQASLLETPLMPGSLSLYGSDPASHAAFANEICAERLMRKYIDDRSRMTRWEWIKVTDDNHYGDAVTQAFALASWFRLYEPIPSVVDEVVLRDPVDADLFDPRHNSAILENAKRESSEAKREEEIKLKAAKIVAKQKRQFRRGRYTR